MNQQTNASYQIIFFEGWRKKGRTNLILFLRMTAWEQILLIPMTA